MKLQGFELEVEGTREDALRINERLGDQISALLRPAGAIVDGEIAPPAQPPINPMPEVALNKKARRRKEHNSTAAVGSLSSAIDFKHAPERYGNPKAEWNTAKKAQWLLYVVKEAANLDGLSNRTLAETFNKHFRQSGKITSNHVSRDLGRLKAKVNPSPVGEDTTKDPPTWYLTEEGRKGAQNSVSEALGQTG
jgi:hypothetical protein